MTTKKLLAEDCDRPSCDDMVSKMQQAAAAAQRTKAANIETADFCNEDVTKGECPLGSSALGRSSWNLLHSMAAWYPDEPNEKEQQHIKNFMAALARFYPCTYCAKDFQKNLERKPVRTKNRKELCQWLCEQHNLVNEKTGKPIFNCDINKLDERWRKSEKPECKGSSLH